MANNNLGRRLLVKAPGGEYPVLLGYGLLTDADWIDCLPKASRLMIVSNQSIADLYLHKLLAQLAHLNPVVHLVEEGEAFKNQQTVDEILGTMLAAGFGRDCLLIALGGGVITDLTGFVASIYMRGVPFVSVPTTLLAQVDAAIGGKTGINHPLGKNMIGSFYQPSAVIIDTQVLETLPGREFRAGLAEMIKYALIAGGDLFEQADDWLLADGDNLNKPAFTVAMAECIQIKADIISRDEREQGERALLNLGHTFAHGLETITAYQRWLHGEAVAIGLYCAALLSVSCSGLTMAVVVRLRDWLVRVGLPFAIPADIDLPALKARMRLDKKNLNQKRRFVLIKAPGQCYVDEQVSETELDQVLASAVQGN